MISSHINLVRVLIAAVAVGFCCDARAVQAPNPRGGTSGATAARGVESYDAQRATVSRSSVRQNVGRTSARGAVVSNAARGAAGAARGGNSGINVRGTNARSATNVSMARSATTPVNQSRAATARATAIFNDISKIGGGYAACRESYATCMDQFCANANDTYRRCYCSSRYADFRNTEDSLDRAKTLLMQFEDNNLNAVDKTAAEVNAMYSATVGEAAIKNDTSGAAKILDEISDLLSGKKKVNSTSGYSSNSLGVLSFDFSDDIDDIWADGGNSIFSGNGGQNLSDLDGIDLYNAAHKQCTAISNDACQSSAVSNMARSSYSILITQDCNAYQKNIDKKVEGVKQTVRQAEKYLREARLEEYRSHNSADVNECISRVRAAMTADTACGANYKRCLDYTGAYISQTTGEPIYSPRLFQLTEIIHLPGYDGTSASMDVLGANTEFNKFLESRKIFAASALDTCRDIQNTVWDEFKRTALIEIAQAQDEKIEEVKMSCVSTMTECYDTQSSALRGFDANTAQMVGALSAYAARQMCVDRVSACAALYSQGENATKCEFDGDGRLTKSTACGLNALLAFVNAVDDTRINAGCETALKNYATELCTDTTTGMGYPWNCRLRSRGEIERNIKSMAGTYCNPDVVEYRDNVVDNIITDLVNDIDAELSNKMSAQCESLGGLWVYSDEIAATKNDNYRNLDAFYNAVYNNNRTYVSNSETWGRCVEATARILCEAYNIAGSSQTPLATYDAATQTCNFSPEWYRKKCVDELGGIWDESTCYIMK